MLRVIEYFAKSPRSLKVIRNDTLEVRHVQVPISILFKLCLHLISFLKYPAPNNGVTLKSRLGSFKFIKNASIQNDGYSFLFTFHSDSLVSFWK